MNKLYIVFLILLTTTLVHAQRSVNPKIGVNFSNLTSDPDTGIVKSRWGFNIGIDLRFGDRFKFIPGIHYATHGTELREIGSKPDLSDEVYIHNLKLPMMAAINLLNADVVQFRVYGGPVGNFFLKTDDNLFLTNENYKLFNLGLKFGAGMDLLVFTLDVDYEVGMTDLFAGQISDKLIFPKNAQNNVLTLNAGIRINKK